MVGGSDSPGLLLCLACLCGLAAGQGTSETEPDAASLPDYTPQCVNGRSTCAEFKSCCEAKRCEPGIYLLFRCAKRSGIFDPTASYCKCSSSRPTPPTSSQAFPNYTAECLDRPHVTTCADFERCCAERTCAAGVERKYECGYYNHNMEIQKSRALCLCQNPTAGARMSSPGSSLLLLALILPLLPWRS